MSVQQTPNSPAQAATAAPRRAKSAWKRLSVLAAAATLAASALLPMQQAAADTGDDRSLEPVAGYCDDMGWGPVLNCDLSTDAGDSHVVDVPRS